MHQTGTGDNKTNSIKGQNQVLKASEKGKVHPQQKLCLT